MAGTRTSFGMASCKACARNAIIGTSNSSPIAASHPTLATTAGLSTPLTQRTKANKTLGDKNARSLRGLASDAFENLNLPPAIPKLNVVPVNQRLCVLLRSLVINAMKVHASDNVTVVIDLVRPIGMFWR